MSDKEQSQPTQEITVTRRTRVFRMGANHRPKESSQSPYCSGCVQDENKENVNRSEKNSNK